MLYNGNIDVLGSIKLNNLGLTEEIEFSKINVMAKPVITFADLSTSTGIQTEGLLCFVLDELALYYYDGSDWLLLETKMSQMEGFKTIDLSTAANNSILKYNNSTNEFELLLLEMNVLSDVDIDKSMTNPFFIYWDDASGTFKNSELLQIESSDDNTKTYSTTFVNTLIKRIELLEDLVLTVKFHIGDFIDEDSNVLTSPTSLFSTKNIISIDIELEQNGKPYYDLTYINVDDSQVTVNSTSGSYPTYNVTHTMPTTGPVTFNVEFTDILDWSDGTVTITIDEKAIKFISPTGSELQNIGTNISLDINPIESEFNITESTSTSKIIDPLNGGQIILDYEINDGIYSDSGTNLIEIVPATPSSLFNINGTVDLNLDIDTINIDNINRQIEVNLIRSDTNKLANLTETFSIDIDRDLFKRNSVANLCHEIFSNDINLTGFQVNNILYSIDGFNFTDGDEINLRQPNFEVNIAGQYDIFSISTYINKDISKIKVKWLRDGSFISETSLYTPSITKIDDAHFTQSVEFTNPLYRGEEYELIIEDGLYTFDGVSKKSTPGDVSQSFSIYDFAYFLDSSKTNLIDGFTLDTTTGWITINTDISSLNATNVNIDNTGNIFLKDDANNEITLSNFRASTSGGNIKIEFDIDNALLNYNTNYTLSVHANSIQYEHTIGTSSYTKIYNNENLSISFTTEEASSEPVEFGFIIAGADEGTNLPFASGGTGIGSDDKMLSDNTINAEELGWYANTTTGLIEPNSNGASVYFIYTKWISDSDSTQMSNIVPPKIITNDTSDKVFIDTEPSDGIGMDIYNNDPISNIIIRRESIATINRHIVILKFENRVTADKVNDWITNNETWLHSADATSTLPSSS
jgi:hypothetical protein